MRACRSVGLFFGRRQFSAAPRKVCLRFFFFSFSSLFLKTLLLRSSLAVMHLERFVVVALEQEKKRKKKKKKFFGKDDL
jgi:hypothetical protein